MPFFSRWPLGRFILIAAGSALLGFQISALLSQSAGASHCPSASAINGTSADDFLVAPDDQANLIRGYAGADYILGKDCSDELRGGDGPDLVRGAFGNDNVFGENGNDNPNNCSIWGHCGELVGGGGSDVIDGGANWDLVDDSYGPDGLDIAAGSGGDDSIDVRDGDTNDAAIGGAGTDSCIVDSASEKDSSCE